MAKPFTDYFSRRNFVENHRQEQLEKMSAQQIKLYKTLLTELHTWVYPESTELGNSWDIELFSAHLIIEIDGYSHLDPRQKTLDEKKDYCAIQNGYTVLRFTNEEIDNNIDGVVEKIKNFISKQFREHYKVFDLCQIYEYRRLVPAIITKIYHKQDIAIVKSREDYTEHKLFFWQIFFPTKQQLKNP